MNRYSKLTPLLSIRRSLCKMLLAGGLLLSAASLLSAQNASHDGQSTEGTDFWVTFLRADSHDGDDKKITLSVSISAREACDVTLENIRSGYKEEVHLNANELKEVQLYYGTARVDKNPRQSDTKICYTYLLERGLIRRLFTSLLRQTSRFLPAIIRINRLMRPMFCRQLR